MNVMKSGSNWKCRLMRAGVVSLLFLVAISGTSLQAASTVATGIDSRGRITWGWAAGSDLENGKLRAIDFRKASGGAHPRILVHTFARGYGAIVEYMEAGNARNVTASVGDHSEQQAINNALNKAKLAGGHTPKLVRTWHDFAIGETKF
jgi:hypothetical protein